VREIFTDLLLSSVLRGGYVALVRGVKKSSANEA